MAMERQVWLAAGLLVGVFMAGVGTGIGVMRMVAPAPPFMGEHRGPPWARQGMGMGRPGGPPPVEHVVELFTRELDLSPEQARQLEAVVSEEKQVVEKNMAEMRPRMEALHARADERIRAILNEDQRARFSQMRRPGGPGLGPPPPPPPPPPPGPPPPGPPGAPGFPEPPPPPAPPP